MARFSVRTLGFPEIRRDDRVCQLALRKGLALLVYLAEAKGSVGRDVVATMLWPESSEDVVRARLRRLSAKLGGTVFHSRGRGRAVRRSFAPDALADGIFGQDHSHRPRATRAPIWVQRFHPNDLINVAAAG